MAKVQSANIYSQPDDTSAILKTVTQESSFEITDLVYGTSQETTKQIIYYKIKYLDSIGYIKHSNVISTYFIDRTN